jgi:hypothetical protein
MAYWTGTEIIYATPKRCEDYPGWDVIDCGCCHGIKWGGDEPIECETCGGDGWIYQHLKSGVLAQYPGGPFCGKAD